MRSEGVTKAERRQIGEVAEAVGLGFTVEEMRNVLSLCDRLRSGDEPEEDGRSLVRRLGEYTAVAAERCERLRVQLADARAMTDQLRVESKKIPVRGMPR